MCDGYIIGAPHQLRTSPMPSNPISGAGYLIQGIGLIARPRLRRFVIVPLLINVAVFSAGIAAGIHWFDGFVQGMLGRIPGWLDWLQWILWPVFVLLLLAVVFYGFALVANLIAAPFNGLLAEKVERHLTGRPVGEDMELLRLLRELIPTLIDEIRKILYAIMLAIPFLILLFVPVAGPVLWFLYTAWILCFQYCDYPMSNNGLKLKAMRKRLRRRRLLGLGFGAATAGLGMVPVLNFIVMPAAVAGATAMWLRELKGEARYQGEHQSRVMSRFVVLVIDQLSGKIGGEVLDGPHAGRPLDEVSTEDLLELLERAYLQDPASAEAIEVYLERERGGRPDTPRSAQHQGSTGRPEAPPPAGRMSPGEARAILGIDPNAGPEAVRAAHKRLMQRLHPDRGGTDYLAAKLNEAKDVLIG